MVMIAGMHCGSCAIAVEALLKKQPKVSDAAVSFAADIAMISWEDDAPDMAQLQRAVAKLGYQLDTELDAKRSATQAAANRKQLQLKLAVAAVFSMWSMLPAVLIYLAPFGVVENAALWPLALASGVFAIPVLFYSGAHFYRVGWRTLLAGAPGLDSLILLAVVAATLISVWRLSVGEPHVYFDAAVMLITFQLLARLLDSGVRRNAAEVVRRYSQDIPEYVTVIKENGERLSVAATEVRLGQQLVLSAGEQLALDGVVIAGQGQADMALLTGEHEPLTLAPGEALLAGCTLIEGELTLVVSAEVGRRRIDNLTQSISRLLSQKSALQRLTDRIARFLLPTIMLAALVAILGSWWQGAGILNAAAHGLAVLIVSCPCALSLAIPLVVTMGHARMIESGIILQDPAALEAAATVTVAVFDKTGTLTTAEPTLSNIAPAEGVSANELLSLAQHILAESQHPVALGLKKATTHQEEPSADSTSGQRESLAGKGTRWQSEQGVALAGNRAWLIEQGISVPDNNTALGMELHIALAARYMGRLEFKETIRAEAFSTVAQLQNNGLEVYLLSGDTLAACTQVANELGIAEQCVLAQRSPEQKQRFISALEKKTPVVFVGDGLNDGLALAGAGLGIAVGQSSSASSMAAAVYLPEGVQGVPATLVLAQRAKKLMLQNLGWALMYNMLVIPLAIAGFIQPVLAALAMSLSSVCVLFNSMRMQRRLTESAEINPAKKT